MKNFNQLMIAAILLLATNMLPDALRAQTLTDYSSNARRPRPATPAADRGNPGGNPDVPIDGGISFLVAAGAAYGANKMRAAKKQKAGKSV